MKKKLISIIIPCFNEGKNVFFAYDALKRVREKEKKYQFEFLFIDNGSSDTTREHITALTRRDHRVVGIYLSRNFGPESSTQAGFDYSKGDAVIWYAADMQEPSETIHEFISKWEEGFDSVVGVYTKLEDSLLMKVLRRSFYRVMKLISDVEIPPNSSGFGLYTRRVVDAMKQLPETYRFQRGIRAWVGFSTAYVSYRRKKRKYGISSYSVMTYFGHAQRSVFGFSYLPLDMLVYAGFIIVFCSFVMICTFFGYSLVSRASIGSTLLILTAIVSFGGINLLALSIIGKYIQVIMEETKRRPTYIIDQVNKKK